MSAITIIVLRFSALSNKQYAERIGTIMETTIKSHRGLKWSKICAKNEVEFEMNLCSLKTNRSFAAIFLTMTARNKFYYINFVVRLDSGFLVEQPSHSYLAHRNVRIIQTKPTRDQMFGTVSGFIRR